MRALAGFALAFLLSTGCEGGEASDAQLYTRVIGASPRLPVLEGLSLCRRIRDAAVAGDCLLSVASTAPAGAASVCPEIPAGLWQEECWFLAAEQHNRQGEAVAAAALCQKAGRFGRDCAQHLWQTPVHGLIHGRGAAGFAEALPAAESLYAAWAPLLAAGPDSDFEDRFWAKFFGNGFEGQGPPLDLGWCQPLPAPHRRAACEAAGVAHYARDLGPAVERAGELLEFCGLSAPTAADLARWLPAVGHPRLDAEAVHRQADICTHAPGAPGVTGYGSPEKAPPAPSTTPQSPGR